MRIAFLALALILGRTAAADVDARLEEARKAIESHLAASRQPGVVIGITDRHRLREVVVHGYADLKTRTPLSADSRFAIGSISKAFTAIALMQIADEGRFDPHAPVNRYLPALRIQTEFAPMTGHDVLSHTAGLPSYLPDTASSQAVMLSLRRFVPSYPPGAHWYYSNTGYQLMGYVLEHLDNGPYDEIIQRRVLAPLGMKDTSAVIDDAQRSHMTVSYRRWPYDGKYVEAPWFEYLAGDGSIVSTVADMAAYARFFLNRGQGENGRLLSEQSFAKLTTPVLENYSYGLEVRQEQGGLVLSHDGGIAGFESRFEAHTGLGFAIVFLSNGGMDQTLQSWVAEIAAAAFADQPPPPSPAPPPDLLLAPLGDYLGHFETSSARKAAADLRLINGDLILREGTTERRLQRMGVNVFRAAAPSADREAYVFARKEDKPLGAVTGFSHGSSWYVLHHASAAPVPSPVQYAEYVGHYVTNGPEGPEARVYVRDGRLFAAMEINETFAPLPLQAVGTATFRLGPERYSPERARFDGIIDGHAQLLLIDGVPLNRRDTP